VEAEVEAEVVSDHVHQVEVPVPPKDPHVCLRCLGLFLVTQPNSKYRKKQACFLVSGKRWYKEWHSELVQKLHTRL